MMYLSDPIKDLNLPRNAISLDQAEIQSAAFHPGI
jgi:hypothetical protein